MESIKFAAIIPARYASVRFPGKPLAMIGDKTMIRRVYEQTIKAVEHVFVATEDERIFKEVTDFGGKAIMTSDQHKSGTDRCYEAYTKLNEKFDVIINVQGDEPFILPCQIEALKDCFREKNVEIATLLRKITPEDGVDYLLNPNHPKAIVNNRNEAVYFSRSVIPYLRNVPLKEYIFQHNFYSHIGIYAYKPEALKKIVALQPSSLEIAESLEQLRWIENGYKIKVGFTDQKTFGIDTPDDINEVEKLC
jgi:3-deoxy-manno-octulosonate cytidylyltransferase (CMP-KDO synthetase)